MDGGKDKRCPICGKPLGRNKICCSRKCYSEWRQHYRKCIVCGKLFRCPPTNMTVCCSAECSKKHRREMAKCGTNDKGLENAHAAYRQSPVCQPNENNHSTKTWTLRAPNGEIYECRNLINFFREHPGLIDGTPRQAWDGITKIKYGMEGKRKNRSYQWKGWSLISWGK